jgi:hypothetical protein
VRALAIALGLSLLAALVWRLEVAEGPVFDRYGRLTAFPGKIAVDCPAQDARTAVILAMGQSNIANETESPPPGAAAHPNVFNFYMGQCAPAAAPLLGASGTGGEWLSLLGDTLIRSGRYDKVVLVPAAVGGQRILRFVEGDLGDMLDETAVALAARYRVTHALWHQGESDFAAGTDPDAYRAMFFKIVERLRRHGVDAPIFLSTATYCPAMAPWRAPNAIQKAQRPDEKRGVFAGIDSDAFDETTGRFDGCHLSRRGQEWAAIAEAAAIEAYDRRR